MELPAVFLLRMKELLQEEISEFLQCYEQPGQRGLRLNPLKCSAEILQRCIPFALSPSPFSSLAYVMEGGEGIGRLPAHHGGLCYVQEPSAASAVTVLSPQPGDKVLDLCAAPGGKSTQIAALLQGEGVLWANEIVRSRASILLSNIERLGVQNAVVSSCHPERLCTGLQGYFDKVLVDAPCSGEGMFRREEAALREWTPVAAAACAQRQAAILDCAALAVREGGVLVYSTCTFSYEENEGCVLAFLKRHPEFEILSPEVSFGREALGVSARRIYPMDGGEGHFVAKLRRTGVNPCRAGLFSSPIEKEPEKMARALWRELFTLPEPEQVVRVGERLYLPPKELPALAGLSVLRAGVELGELKGKRVEPAHGLFQSRRKGECRSSVDFPCTDDRLLAYLRGEEIAVPAAGYTAVCVEGISTGFGKASEGRLKNKYPKGLRNMK